MRWKPCVVRSKLPGGELDVTVGHPLVDEYLGVPQSSGSTEHDPRRGLRSEGVLLGGRQDADTGGECGCDVVHPGPPGGGSKVVHIDGSDGLSSRTIRRRLSSVAGLYAYLLVRGDTSVSRNPVPRGLVTRREREGHRQGAPLVRSTQTLPRVLSPAEVDALFAALRTDRDRAMVEAMVLGGLRRCEVLGLELADVRLGERRVFVSDGKGGRQRLIPMSGGFFATLGNDEVGHHLGDDERSCLLPW